MINGNVNEFVDGLYYGDERWFMFRGVKYFIQGWVKNEEFTLELEQMEPEPKQNSPLWTKTCSYDRKQEIVKDFLSAHIWDGKTFWQAEQEMEWVDD